VRSLSMDRAYRSSPLIGSLTAQGIAMIAQPWPWHNRRRFPKEQFQRTLERHEVPCPAGVTVRLTRAGRRAHFLAALCRRCVL
jgi:hypothetical protein